MTTAELLDEMTERIVREFHPVRVILFGSRARGEARPDSDVDLLVVLDHVDDRRRAAVAIGRLFRDLTVAKDVIVTTPEEIEKRGGRAGTGLRQALKEGKTLYQRER